MRKLLALILPIAVTIIVFLVLYNNLFYGRAILLGLILIGVACIVAAGHFPGDREIISTARATCFTIVSALGTILIVELLFPTIMPAEYAQVSELSKGFVNFPGRTAPADTVVFGNADQRFPASKGLEPMGSSPVRSWHVPGREFSYYGYDPNSGRHYLNLFHWNSRGYFDHDYDTTKKPGIHRIVVIGDSYVESIQVPLARTFHKRMEGLLNQSLDESARQRFEVIALGNSGTGQRENNGVLRTLGMAYKPDVVVMTLCSNDFCDDNPGLSRDRNLYEGAATPLFRGLVVHGYYALAFAVKRIQDIKRNRIEVSPELLQWSQQDVPAVEEAWKTTLQFILDSRNFCDGQGAQFVLVYLGSDLEVRHALHPADTIARLKAMGGPHSSIAWDVEKSIRRATRFCEENDIVLVSLLEPFITAQQETGHLVFGDHYTLFGHQIAAGYLSSALATRMQGALVQVPSWRHSLATEQWGELSPAPETLPLRKATSGANP